MKKRSRENKVSLKQGNSRSKVCEKKKMHSVRSYIPATCGLYVYPELPNKQQRQKGKLDQLYDLYCSYNKDKCLRSNSRDSCYRNLTEIC